MWTRKELKAKAKGAFKRNYWLCVLAALIMAVVTGAFAASVGGYTKNSVGNADNKALSQADKEVADILTQSFEEKEITINGKKIEFNDSFTIAKLTDALNEASNALEGGKLNINGKDIDISSKEDMAEVTELITKFNNALEAVKDYSDDEVGDVVTAVVLGILGVLAIIFIISILLKIFVFNPLSMGCSNFFMKNCREKAAFGEVGRGFSPKYGRNVGGILLTDLFVALWSLLFIIPGIIKTYSYRMVPYILADDPDIKAKDAITLSRKMMNGNKWKSFVLDLSFIGWYLLSALTFGILAIFYVNPYFYNTDAQLYEALKNGQSTEHTA